MGFRNSVTRQLRRRIGPPLQMFGYKTGLMWITARIMRVDGAITLMYHSVAGKTRAPWIDPSNHVPSDIFEVQIEYLVQHKRVVSLSELITILRRGKTPEKGTVVITFDDGYLDNLTVAAPVLDRYGLSATLFLPTNYIDRGETQWVDEAYTAFEFRTVNDLSWGESTTIRYDLSDAEQYSAGYRAVCTTLLEATGTQRRTLLNRLLEHLQPSESPPRLTMTWDDVNVLLSNHKCFQIGGHSMEHTDLTRISRDEAKNELEGCAQTIEERIGVRPKHFSFPYGRTSCQLRELVARVGFENAFGRTGTDPITRASTDLFAMPRVKAPRSIYGFDLMISSANTGIWRKLGQ